jgi:hypothetical protein
MTLEISLETRGLTYLREQGCEPIKRGQNGEPDRQVLWGQGHHFWIEFKKPASAGRGAGRIRPGQKVWAKYLRGIGDKVYFVDTFEELQFIVRAHCGMWGPATAGRDAAFNR